MQRSLACYFLVSEVTSPQSSFRRPVSMVPPEANGRPRTQAAKSRWDLDGRYFEISLPSGHPLISKRVPFRPGTAPSIANKFLSLSTLTILKFLIVIR